MSSLLANPFIQSAVLPFMATVVLAALINRVAGRWRGLAAAGGFYLSAALIAGLQVLPLTSTRKILLLGVLATVVALLFVWRKIHGQRRNGVLVIVAVVAAIWVAWPVLMREQGLAWWTLVVAVMVYTGWILVSFDTLHAQVATQLLTLTAFAAATAIAATIGATALIGQLAGAIAAACGALLLMTMLAGKTWSNDMLLLPLILMTGLFGIAAVIYARLPWQSLIILMAVPLVPRLPLTLSNIWLKIIAQAVLMLPIAAAAVYLAWGSAGDSYY